MSSGRISNPFQVARNRPFASESGCLPPHPGVVVEPCVNFLRRRRQDFPRAIEEEMEPKNEKLLLEDKVVVEDKHDAERPGVVARIQDSWLEGDHEFEFSRVRLQRHDDDEKEEDWRRPQEGPRPRQHVRVAGSQQKDDRQNEGQQEHPSQEEPPRPEVGPEES